MKLGAVAEDERAVLGDALDDALDLPGTHALVAVGEASVEPFDDGRGAELLVTREPLLDARERLDEHLFALEGAPRGEVERGRPLGEIVGEGGAVDVEAEADDHALREVAARL